MNKHFFTFVAAMLMLFFTNKSAFATDQYPDYIIINGEKFELYVDWSFPSPLQTYFNRTGIECPFRMWSTANYRGHIATWTVRDSALYLTQIDTRRQYGRTGTYLPNTHKPLDTIASPSYFGIQSLGYQAADGEGNVLADWFTGTIIAQRYLDPKDQEILYDDNSSKREKQKAKKRLIKQRKQNDEAGDLYLYVRNGKVLVSLSITPKDMERARNISDKDTSDHVFMGKYQMLYLNQNYIQYHLSQGLSHDTVVIDGHGGQLEGSDGKESIVMDYFDNDPLNWPLNWENFSLCGAPVAQVEVIHDSVFITSLKASYTQGMFDLSYVDVPMDSIFPNDVLQNGRLFASWLNGRHTMQYTVFDNYEKHSYSKVYIDKIQRLDIKDGVVQHSQFYPTSFEQDRKNGLDRAKHFCDPQRVCCTKFGLWLPIDIKQLPKVTEDAAYLGEKNAMIDFLKQHFLTDTNISGRFMIGFGLNRNGIADHFWMTDLRDGSVIDWGEAILDAVRKLPQQWSPAKYASKEGEEAQPVDSYQVIDVTIEKGKFTSAHLHR